MTTQRLLTPMQVEERFGITRRKLHYWRQNAIGPEYIRLGHRTLYYDARVLEDYIQRNTHTPTVRASIEGKRVHL